MMLKIKLLFQRLMLISDYDAKLKKNGHYIYWKKKEVHKQYLDANKRKDVKEENKFKGWLECLEWLLEES